MNIQLTSENSNFGNFKSHSLFLYTNKLKIKFRLRSFPYRFTFSTNSSSTFSSFHLEKIRLRSNSLANGQTLIVLIRSRSRARQPRFNGPRFLVPPFIHRWRIMHAAISIRSNSILVRGRRARRVEFPYRPPADGMEMRGWKTTRLELYLDASFSVSCRVSRETQTQILWTTALFDGTLAQNSTETFRILEKRFFGELLTIN